MSEMSSVVIAAVIDSLEQIWSMACLMVAQSRINFAYEPKLPLVQKCGIRGRGGPLWTYSTPVSALTQSNPLNTQNETGFHCYYFNDSLIEIWQTVFLNGDVHGIAQRSGVGKCKDYHQLTQLFNILSLMDNYYDVHFMYVTGIHETCIRLLTVSS